MHVHYRGMPRYENCSRIIFLLLLISVVDGFGKPKSYKHHRKSSKTSKHCNPRSTALEKSPNNNSGKLSTVDYDPHYKCDLVGFGIVQKIPYKTLTSSNNLIDVNLSSACVRCGICLAIAEKINQTLMEVHDSMSTNQSLEDDEVDPVFRFVCDEQFRHYALRELEGKRYIGDSLPGAVLVITSIDGSWEKHLKTKCHEILAEVGTGDLYKHWRNWFETASYALGDMLCRSESVGLRDCHGIDGEGKRSEDCQNFYRADIKVVAKLG
ncbi:uncharacterized protein [Venturia canescens]|uniref:uncharacterized protein n=1 Tax=Venturia canescens TaxID=32260 RepID=UPI001C9C7B68|nr:uncharacterized protein LOC122409039 [Venturia canescens]